MRKKGCQVSKGWAMLATDALGSRRAEFEFTDLGEVPIRGKAEPVRVWAVVQLKR
jgi:class 3 adenylate cyclase